MALTWVDRQLSPDALAEAVGVRTALHIYSARLRHASTHAKIVPVPINDGRFAGIAIADLCYSCCWKPIFFDDVQLCQSCSSVRVANESGAIYIAAPTMHTTPQHCYIDMRIPDIRCASCNNRFIVKTVVCPNCNAPPRGEYLVIYLGRHSSLIPSTESLIREIFDDEIRQCEV